MRILVTFPGKIGDLLYALPLVRSLKAHVDCTIDFMTSEYCRCLIPLLEHQSCIERAFVDNQYMIKGCGMGIQPADMFEPPGYDRIFHLGYRPEIIGSPLWHPHLIEAHYETMERRYGIQLKRNYGGIPYIDRPDIMVRDYVVFHGYSESLMGYRKLMDGRFSELIDIWKEIFAAIKKKVIFVSGKNDANAEKFYSLFDCEVEHPKDFMDTAKLIAGSRLFIGAQSSCYVCADGMAHSMLVLETFRQVNPTQSNAVLFRLDKDVMPAVRRAKRLMY